MCSAEVEACSPPVLDRSALSAHPERTADRGVCRWPVRDGEIGEVAFRSVPRIEHDASDTGGGNRDRSVCLLETGRDRDKPRSERALHRICDVTHLCGQRPRARRVKRDRVGRENASPTARTRELELRDHLIDAASKRLHLARGAGRNGGRRARDVAIRVDEEPRLQAAGEPWRTRALKGITAREVCRRSLEGGPDFFRWQITLSPADSELERWM